MFAFDFNISHSRKYILSYRAEYDLFQIELSKNYGTVEWREDLKKVMIKAGLDNTAIVFLFSDTQVCGILKVNILYKITRF